MNFLQMVNKQFYRPAAVPAWMVVIFERRQRFGDDAAADMIKGLLTSFASVGKSSHDHVSLCYSRFERHSMPR